MSEASEVGHGLPQLYTQLCRLVGEWLTAVCLCIIREDDPVPRSDRYLEEIGTPRLRQPSHGADRLLEPGYPAESVVPVGCLIVRKAGDDFAL